MLTPRDTQDLCETLSSAHGPFYIEGLGTKRNMGRPTTGTLLSLKNFTGIKIYEPSELILETGAAAPLDEIEILLAKHNQQLAFEPPDYSRITGNNHRGSIGSVLACNLSGPRRLTAGAARDHVLGIEGVSGLGEAFKAGGRVVKNVTGYDMPRLMAGSFGTLAALTTVTFKVLPRAETETTIIIPCTDIIAAGRIMREALQSPHDVSSAAWTRHGGVTIRLEGISSSVKDRTSKVIALLNQPNTLAQGETSKRLWKEIRDLSSFAPTAPIIWKISVAPTEGPALAQKLEEQGANIILDWSGGLIWAAMSNFRNIRTLMTSGQAMLFKAPDSIRETADVFHPQAPHLAALSQRLKSSLDPKSLLNPGRMYKGV